MLKVLQEETEIFRNFLKKKPAKEEPPKMEKLTKPHNLPQAVGRDIINLGKDPDWVWHLKSVVRPSHNEKDRYDVRVFDETQASSRGASIENYNSLDQHPELILFEGWYDRKSWRAHIKEKKVRSKLNDCSTKGNL